MFRALSVIFVSKYLALPKLQIQFSLKNFTNMINLFIINESLRLSCIKPLHSAPWFLSVKHHKFSWHHQATCWSSAWRRWDCLQLHSPLQEFSSSQLPVPKKKNWPCFINSIKLKKNPYLNKSELNYSITHVTIEFI